MTTTSHSVSATLDVPRPSGVVSRDAFRDGMAKLAAAVSVVTSDGPGGKVGFTASSVCSVTDARPTLLVCLNRSASVHAAVIENGVLAVNTLAPHHTDLSNRFGGLVPTEERFRHGSWTTGPTGSPLLDDAVVNFDCRIVGSAEIGTHTVLFCEVVDIAGPREPAGLIYFDRAYHTVATITAA
jgi:flavin reductase